LDNQEPVVMPSSIYINNTILLEAMARTDVDCIFLDVEHGVYDDVGLTPYLQVLRLLGMPSIVRAQDSEYHLVAKLLDMGADGVMLPRVETVAQLKKAVDGFFFPPIGKKGKGGHGHLRFGEAFGDYAKTRFLMPQIESPEGVKNLPAMLEAYGEYISAVIIGPYDLSITNGTPCDITSEVNLKSIQDVFDTCKRYGKSCGIFCENEACAKRFKEMGANVIWIGSDLDMFMRGYNQFVNEVKTLF
jgi:2-keto-3-deoxy-L-rhamnonate aldolase RhmA